ncbi:hypothetical protein COU78_04320 [Candidatus Peregrinibacteria bacterium CG10_big_fil_rev_8_21_14_0_10_49_24]|nr:MAG: hypothetical protein COU78_04320 [Candidatus Peregrinibacteria bacterium CG10_big_fil_rev_8_21_14_0_10_49_24]PJA67169.1 MAG: hypothetical protein CO157_06250 [Candidatus Peregrinibacteria bacterium CG_4_9_14_3_um_filter_49_12]
MLVIAVGLSAIPAHAQGIFGPVPTLSEYFPSGSQQSTSSAGAGGAQSPFGDTFSTTEEGVFGPVPTLADYFPSAKRGDSVLGGSRSDIFGETPNVTSGGFGGTFSTTEEGVFGPVPTLNDYLERGSR